jgi:CRP-like cAMP-binding protein
MEGSYINYSPVKTNAFIKHLNMTTEQMLAKCRSLKDKKIGRRKTYDDEFSVYKLEASKTLHLIKVSTNMQSMSKIKLLMNDDEGEEIQDDHNIEMMRMVTPEEEAKLKNMISTNFLFSNFDDKNIALLVDDLIEFNLDMGRTLYEEGDDGHFFYLVFKGELEVLEKDERKKIISEGECLGELALLQKSKRTSTVRAVTDCILFVLEGTIFRKLVKKMNNEKTNELLAYIEKISILQTLEPLQKYNIASLVVKHSYTPGQMIVNRGDDGDRMFIIKEGHISCVVNNKEIQRLGPGDLLGESSLIFETKRAVDVCSIDCSKLYIITKKNLEEALGVSYRKVVLYSFFKQTAKDSKFFMGLFNEFQFEDLFKLFKLKKYKNNEIVFPKDCAINKKLVFIFQGNICENNKNSERIGKRSDIYGEVVINSEKEYNILTQFEF